ncbi:glycosyltransferase [Mesobacillus jeotgali]|uniref:glycosyltransferase n=1 Tax=Mesobacillus jeotgali TaxID=129985 RepID=UPI001315141C|nr:glycosyltransferase [Mesobacillus jeotgali]
MYKKKVVCVVPSLSSGGAEKMALDLVTYLDKEKFDVTLISLYSNKGEAFSKLALERGVNVYYLDKKSGFDIKTILKLSKVLTNLKPHVIHTHLYSSIYCMPWINLHKKTIWVHTVHNIANKELPSPYLKIMEYFYKRKKAIPIGISEEIRKTISYRYNLKLADIPLIHNGIDTKFFSPVTKIENGTEEIVFSCVARFSPQKNHELLINAFNFARKKYSNMKLLLIGDGLLRKDIEKQIASYGLEDHVLLVGNSSNVIEWLRKSDIFVLSSNYEGLPLSILEAMSVGLPVIGTRVGGVPDVLIHGEEGLTVPPMNAEELANAMIDLALNHETRSNMSLKARKKALEFDVRKMADKYGDIYQMEIRNISEV